MKRTGPYLTLLGGFAVAAVLTVMSAYASQKADSTGATTASSGTGAAGPAATGSAPPAASGAPGSGAPPSGAPASGAPASRAPNAARDATYAGRVAGGGATIAISVKNGRAIAYLCDGKRTEAWLQGAAANGRFTLSGARGANLAGTFARGVAKGTLSAGGRQWTFTVSAVAPPSGLYRASANVRNATVVGGWICLPGTGCVGTYTTDGENPAPGPELDQQTGTAVIDGTTVQAEQL